MKARQSLALLSAAACSIFASCEKKEKPYPLPPQGDATGAIVVMGPDYSTQIFYNFETGIVDSSANDSWDISFSNKAGTAELWANSGSLVFVKATGMTDLAAVTDTLSSASKPWVYDDPSGLDGSSGLGNLITNSHTNEVILVNVQRIVSARRIANVYKMKITAITDETINLQIDTLNGSSPRTVNLARNTDYNYTYYSFANGVVMPEPQKADWDIVFTRYQHIYRDYFGPGLDFLYPLNGALLNPHQTTAADDSLNNYDFSAFTLEKAVGFTFFPNRDVIGFDWKVADISDGSYVVNPNKIFLVKTQAGALWKLHFTGFYSNGQKGSPQFEFKRLQ